MGFCNKWYISCLFKHNNIALPIVLLLMSHVWLSIWLHVFLPFDFVTKRFSRFIQFVRRTSSGCQETQPELRELMMSHQRFDCYKQYKQLLWPGEWTQKTVMLNPFIPLELMWLIPLNVRSTKPCVLLVPQHLALVPNLGKPHEFPFLTGYNDAN